MPSQPNSNTSHVDTGRVRYPIMSFTGDILEPAAAISQLAPDGRLIIISDSNVEELYQGQLQDALTRRGRTVRTLSFPAGESSKSIEVAHTLWQQLLAGDIDRQDTIIALGGGVTGDLAGFVASTVLRGIHVIQMPTTMLAMSDAAIGGKTGINVGAGKNLVGAFHQPLAVIHWLPSLKTLDKRELCSGMAEVIKSAIIDGQHAVDRLRQIEHNVLNYDIKALHTAAQIGASLKAHIVSKDVHEQGVRSHLNLGHTFGHAIEHAVGYGAWTHGEAVAAGMVIAARYSVDHEYAEPSFVDDVTAMINAVELPTSPPDMSIDEWLKPIVRDKKRTGDAVKLILATGMGGVFSEITPFDTLREWLKQHIAV